MTRAATKSGILHISMAKQYILMGIDRFGAAEFLGPKWAGRDAEAKQAVRDDPREYFCGCDNTNPDGSCAGHDGE